MGTQVYSYQTVRKKLMAQLRRCRDRDVRIKVEVILCALKLGNVALACGRLLGVSSLALEAAAARRRS
jgi:hypothetical protein